MTKSDSQVIEEFQSYVNMTPEELEEWLETEESQTAGWSASGEGEAVGHQSGRKIIEILRKNPKGKPDDYDEEDIKHMRKVAAYCARHLAQEGHLKEQLSEEELEEKKSTRSLKNWGHDPLKA
ncbi:hypothetical protein BCR35DRAFT_300968 [Leucosporidium creatinivorum]|uniref:DNA-binding protein n=1 Tax=Leucosporidium creatinivorum TaxID=106004 RepID=A0A1Y2FYL7_9BASI|nr:hypothetical protein BCR35DRAFT_300968 [Leucosporidium creatinivorum]